MRVSKLSMNKKLNKRFNNYTKKQYGSGDSSIPNGTRETARLTSARGPTQRNDYRTGRVSNMVEQFDQMHGLYNTNHTQVDRKKVRLIPSNLQPKNKKQPIAAQRTRTTGSPSPTRPVPIPAQRPQRPSSSSPRESAAANINKLLEMLDIDKNNIAKQLKGKLGTTNNEVTRKVDELFKHLEQLKNHINSTIPQDENDDSFLKLRGRDVYAKKKFTLKSGVYKKINEDDSPSDERELGVFTGLDNLKAQSVNKPETLDTQIENKETLLNGADQIELDEAGVNTLQNRLLNCQKLEFYYLKKHDEVIKIFTFLLNLFDKYKYQGELLLFLLKYLVTKPDKPDRPYKSPTIRIPKSIILNIKKLIQDQDTIQDVIDQMSTDINSNNPLTATSDPSVDIKLGSEHVTSPNSYEHNYQESRAGSTGNTGSTAV
jgi:hypothetical protein